MLETTATSLESCLEHLSSLPYEKAIEESVKFLTKNVLQGIITKQVTTLGATKAEELLSSAAQMGDYIASAIKSEKELAPLEIGFIESRKIVEIAKKEGSQVTKKAVEIVKENPQLLTPDKTVYQVVADISTELKTSGKTGTVWDFIKMTDVMYENTKIPRSFELTVGNQKFWVHPNATDHMREYIAEAIETTHSMPINSQTVLTSFKAAKEEASLKGFKFDETFTVGCWEFIIGKARQEGLFSSIYHAMFKPKGYNKC